MTSKLALLLTVWGLSLAAQPVLEGTVTDPINHTGLAGVSVRLTAPSREDHETTTDESGGFLFNNLPFAAYTVILSKEGYIPADGSDKFWGRLPVVRPGAERVSLEMLPLSEMRGRVLHSDGTPAAGVELLLEHAAFTQRTVKTGDDGAFVFADLRPGSYHMLARPRAASPGNDRVAEAATYYPEAPDSSQAQEVLLRAGATVSGIDIRLRSIQLYPLSGVVVNDSGDPVKAKIEVRKRDANASAALHLIGAGVIAGGNSLSVYAPPDPTIGDPYSSAASEDGRFSFSLPEGEWTVHARSGASLVGDVTVLVPSQHQDSLQIPLEQPFDLKATVELEGEPNTQPLPLVVLRAAASDRPIVIGLDESMWNLDSGRAPQKSISFDQIRPGAYSVSTFPVGPVANLYLAGFSVAGQSVIDRTFYLSPTTTGLRAVFRRANGGLQGRTEKGEPATILIIPDSDSPGAILCLDSPTIPSIINPRPETARRSGFKVQSL